MESKHRLLLAACIDRDDAELVRRALDSIQATDADPDAEQLYPLLHAAVRDLGLGDPAHPANRRLACCYKQVWIRNHLLLHQARPVFSYLERAGIRWALLKGGAISSSAYHDDLGVRPLADFDLLIERTHIRTVVAWVLSRGWRVDETSRWDADDFLHAHHAVDLRNDTGGALDLHHALLATDRSPDLDDRLLDATVRTELGDRPVPILAPTAHLLHTLAHARPEGFRHIADAATIIARHREAIDWDEMVGQARARRALAAVDLALTTLGEVAPGRVPPSVLKRVGSTPRHWTDWTYQARPIGSRLQGLRVFATDVAQRLRGQGVGDWLRTGRLVARRYAASSADDITTLGKIREFLLKGPRHKRE